MGSYTDARTRRRQVAQKRKGKTKQKCHAASDAKASERRCLKQIAKWQQKLEDARSKQCAAETPSLRKRTQASRPQETPATKVVRSREDEADQRIAIRYFYRRLDSPPEEDWDGQCGTISEIRALMGDSPPGSATVRRTLERIAEDDIDLRMRQHGERSRKLSHEDDILVGLMLVEGYSQQTAADMLNQERVARGEPMIDRKAIREAEERVELVRRRRRSTKAGSVDEESDWARASEAQSVQFADQLRRGELQRTRAAYAGPTGATLKVGAARVKMDADDEWGVLGSEIKVVGSWWGKQWTGKKYKGPWPCRLVAYRRSYKWADAGNVPTYFIECTKEEFGGEIYAMQAADVRELLPPAKRQELDAAEASTADLAPQFVLDQLLCIDEYHRDCVLGKISKFDCKMPTKDGAWCSAADGGEYPDWSDRTAVKYSKQVRFMLGVSMKRNADGSFEGRRMAPFEYTGKWVVGVKKYREAFKAEVARSNRLKGGGEWSGTKKYTNEQLDALEGGRYEARYGNGWRDQVKAALAKGDHGLCCVTDLMDHAIDAGGKLFADTEFKDSWWLHHDALSAWWEKEAQEHLAARGFRDRQLRAWGETNEEFPRYHEGLVGNRPEMMPMDFHLNFEVADGVDQAVIHTSSLKMGPPGDPCRYGRYGAGTPEHLAATVRHVWSHSPTSERIVQDISRLSTTIEQIIAHKGCLVPDLVIHASKKGCSRTRRKGGSRLGPQVSAVAQKRVAELRKQAQSLCVDSK